MTVYPVKFEAADESFRLSAFDEESAEVYVDALVNTENWPEISDAIMRALNAMKEGV